MLDKNSTWEVQHEGPEFKTQSESVDVTIAGEGFVVRRSGDPELGGPVLVNGTSWSVQRILTDPVYADTGGRNASVIPDIPTGSDEASKQRRFEIFTKLWNVCRKNIAADCTDIIKNMPFQTMLAYLAVRKSIPEYVASIKHSDGTRQRKVYKANAGFTLYVKPFAEAVQNISVRGSQGINLKELPDHVTHVLVHIDGCLVRGVATLGFMNIQRFHLKHTDYAHYVNVHAMACLQGEGSSTRNECYAMIQEISNIGRHYGCASVYTAPRVQMGAYTMHFMYKSLGFRFCRKMPVFDVKDYSIGMALNIS